MINILKFKYEVNRIYKHCNEVVHRNYDTEDSHDENFFVYQHTTPLTSCFMYFENLEDFAPNFTNSKPAERFIHSEYKYGDCDRPGIIFYSHIHLDSLQFLGKLFVRGWLDIRRIPLCVILRAKSMYNDQLRSTAYPFQFCIPRIAYCHSHKRYRYYYYEWYIPYNYDGGMEWDLYFYGSPSMTW